MYSRFPLDLFSYQINHAVFFPGQPGKCMQIATGLRKRSKDDGESTRARRLEELGCDMCLRKCPLCESHTWPCG